MNLLRRVFVERRAVVVPLTVFLVGNIAVLALVVWPLQRTVAGGKESQWQATQQVAAARTQETQAKMDRAGKDRADTELRKFYTEILPKDERTAIGAATFSLTRLADEANVTFKVGQWDREAVKDSTLTRLSGQVTLVGEYSNVRRFLYEVETAQEFVIIESVELSSASVTQNDNMLELGLVIATYYRPDCTNGGGEPMKMLPAAGPERTRLIVLLALLGIAGAAWYYGSGTAAPIPAPTMPGRTAANAPAVPRDTAAAPQSSRQTAKPTVPEALKLAELEKVPDEPEPGRNPFRFGAKPAPPPPPSLPPPMPAPTPIVQPPPPPPQVPLKLTTVIDDPYGKKRAFLVDGSGAMFQAVDGDIVDGRYRLVKVEKTSAIVEFRDGSGRKTIYLGSGR